MYGGTLQTAGVAIPGLPFTTLGHNRYCSVAMTTGGPDTGDIYEEEVDPKNPRKYKYDDAWRNMTVRTEIIQVQIGDQLKEQRFEIEATQHGPVVAARHQGVHREDRQLRPVADCRTGVSHGDREKPQGDEAGSGAVPVDAAKCDDCDR